VSADDELARERRARGLLQWVALAAAEAASVGTALQAAVDEVCRHTGWPLGHALLRGPDGRLTSAGIWHADGRFAPFRAATEAQRFEPGVGLPGQVLASGRPHWIMDVTRDENFPRAAAAETLGLRAAFAFPVLSRREVLAVLEFFSSEAAEPDLPLLEVMATVGTQLARVMERTRAEEALKQSELRFRSVTETAHDAIITADADGRIVSWNRAAEGLFGHTEAEAVGQPLTLIVPPRLRAQHTEGMARVRVGGERKVIGRTLELDGLRKDGSEFPLELSLATWAIGGERLFTGILRDITERRVQAAKLAASERAAVETSRAKSLFLASMSHELRTPLNAILGFVQLMERDATLTTEQRDNLGVILRAGEHLLGLINDVLSLSKIEAGESTLNPVDFALRRVLEGVSDLFRARAERRGLSLAFEVAPDLPPSVRGDEGKLRQVLINLVGNAVKFTERGGVTVRVRARDGRAGFEIADTGPGIAPEALERVFEPFVQAQAGAGAGEGVGLGLAISRHFVRLLGGELRATSELGRGSCFAFEAALPAAAGDGPPAPEARRVLELAPGQGEIRVLVVDDDADSRRLLVRLLSTVGFVVEEARDGREAVARWAELRPRLVWMDMRMPGLDGYEATRAIRARETARTAIIALTASAFEHDRPLILAAGCDDIVAKPFREAAVFEVMARWLDVRYVYDDVALDAETRALSPARLAALPPDERAELERSLDAGDDLEARAAVARIAARDPVLGDELMRLVRDLQLDELLGLLERARA
jgi:two-component system sensor histidine kinase/response regulator